MDYYLYIIFSLPFLFRYDRSVSGVYKAVTNSCFMARLETLCTTISVYVSLLHPLTLMIFLNLLFFKVQNRIFFPL